MRILRNTIVLIVLFFVSNVGFSQEKVVFTAREYFLFGDYNRALREYLILRSEQPEKIWNYHKIGICYLNIDGDKSRAKPYLQKVLRSGKYNKDLYVELGLVAMYEKDFGLAINYFESYLVGHGGHLNSDVKRYIKNCKNAQALLDNPVNVEFVNLGPKVNSEYSEFLPYVTKAQDKLYFSSGRVDNIRKIESVDGYFTSDIYVSSVENGEWGVAKGIGQHVNTVEDEKCVYISPKGNMMIIYMDNKLEYGDLLIAHKSADSTFFSAPTAFEKPANSPHLETQGTITEDESCLIIASDRPGGFGGIDLYALRKLPNGTWGKPLNLGPKVNTEYDEGYPTYDEKSKMLYFASQGHNSMGGYDIFKIGFDVATQKLDSAINMGYPINTFEDNFQFTLAGNNRDGYISAYRPEGLGGLDLYKVIFKEVDEELSVITGAVCSENGALVKGETQVSLINLTDKNAKPDTRTVTKNKGKYVFAVPPGNYMLRVANPGFSDSKKVVPVYGKGDYIFKIKNDDIMLEPKKTVTDSTTTK